MMKGLFQLFALSCYVPFLDASLISRVAIIGGGPGGLALAASLRNLNAGVADIVVYESRADIASTTVGGGVQLSGGAKMLKLLGILPDLEGCAEKVANVVGRNTHGSKVLGINLNRFKTKNSDSNSDILRTEEGAPLLFSIMRSSLQKILFKATQTPSVKSNSSIHVQLNSSIKGIAQEENQKYSVHLKDGTVGSDFDMVFGCDGVNSVIREYIYCSQSPHCLLEDSNCVLNPLLIPHYNGLRVGFVLTKVDSAFNVRPDARGLFRIWLGDGVFGLEGSFGSFEGPQHMLALMYRDNRHASVGTNTEWSANSLLEFYQKKLNESGLNKVVEIQNLMNAADSSRCVDIGLKEATIPLPTWSSGDGRVILMGDSAHAMYGMRYK